MIQMTEKQKMPFEVSEKERDNALMVFGGHILFQTLYSAVEFDLFTLLFDHEQLSRKEISEILGIEEQPTRILLLGLVNVKFLKRSSDGFYSNTPISQIFFTKQSPNNLIAYVKLQHHVMYKGMFYFYDSLKAYKNEGLQAFEGNEPTLYQRLAHDPIVKQVFQDAMHELSISANKDLVRNLDLFDIKYLVDIGGGDGTNSIELIKNFPEIKAAVFDLPTVCPIAEKKIFDLGFSDQIKVIPGNCFRDNFPREADCFLFCHFCTIWSEEKNKILFRKAFDALPKGGKIIIFNMMQNNDESGPLTASLGSPYFLTIATGEGMLYTWAEYEEWLKDSGFSKVKSIKLEQDHGLIIGIK